MLLQTWPCIYIVFFWGGPSTVNETEVSKSGFSIKCSWSMKYCPCSSCKNFSVISMYVNTQFWDNATNSCCWGGERSQKHDKCDNFCRGDTLQHLSKVCDTNDKFSKGGPKISVGYCKTLWVKFYRVKAQAGSQRMIVMITCKFRSKRDEWTVLENWYQNFSKGGSLVVNPAKL